MANIKQIVSAQLSQRQRKINQQAERAALFDPDRLLCNIVRVATKIKVPGRPGFVWCQEYSPSNDTNPFHAFNDKVQAREGLTVWIAAGLGGRREILDWNNATIVNTPIYKGQKYLPLHHNDHEWPDFKPGPDVVNVYPRSLSMLRTYPGEAGALTVSASPLRYVKGNTLVVFPGKNSLNISASQPASGLARFVGIYLDPDDNTLKSVNGATTGDSPAITPDSPAFPESAILSANVRLNGDQTVFSEVDIVDVRQILDASGAIDGVRASKLVTPDGLTDPVVNANNSGDVGIGTTGQDARLDVLDTGGAQLRLTFEDGVKFADFTLDTNHDLTITSTGQIILQPTTDSIDFFQVLDTSGGAVFLANTTDQTAAIGTTDTSYTLQGGTTKTGLFIESPDASGFHSFTLRKISDSAARQTVVDIMRARVGPAAVQSGDGLGALQWFAHDGTDFNRSAGIIVEIDGAVSANTVPGKMILQTTETNSLQDRIVIEPAGNVGLSVSNPSTRLDIGGGAIEFDEMTAPGAGAVNTARLYAEDNGAGKTRLMVIFNTGAAVQIAIQP